MIGAWSVATPVKLYRPLKHQLHLTKNLFMKKLATLFLCSLLVCCLQPVTAQALLNPKTQPQFVNPLPIPSLIDARNGQSLNIVVSQFEQNLGLIDPVTKQPLLTKVWGYNHSYPGPTILVQKDVPLDIRWENGLRNGSSLLPHLLTVDPSVHWALMDYQDWQSLGVPIVTHLHGGHTESASDGLPEAWFTPDFALKGKDFIKETSHYSNDQEAATIWYHDHALGITRLNVYAGLAGYYLVTDNNEQALQSNHQLPASPYDLGLAIQDRMFTATGQLHYQTMPMAMGSPESSIMPEFFGDFILVNGKAWPVLEVEPRTYRFRVLNGSDSRFYNLYLSSGQAFTQIGTDNGLLPSPVSLSKMLVAPGERKDVLIDFSDPKLQGQTIVLQNNAKTPYPKGMSVDPQTTGRIMAFRVTKPLNSAYPQTTLPQTLRAPIVPLTTNLAPRKLILFEASDEYNRLKPMLGTFEEGVKEWHDPITENINQGNTEMWEVYNLTADAHPVHLHMVHMQLVNRQKFSAAVDMENGKPFNLRLQGKPVLPSADEAGWKDTYISYPGEVLRVIANFDMQGLYVWHCHILSHEDHEMMRPFLVQPSLQVKKQSVDRTMTDEPKVYQLQAVPNPFNSTLNLRFLLPKKATVRVNIYNSTGALVTQLFNGTKEAGWQQVAINGSGWSNGTYFCELLIDGQRLLRKLVLDK